MKSVLKFLPAATLALGLAFGAVPAAAQQKASPAAIAAAKEILVMKSADKIYANAVPGTVEQVKGRLIAQNLNYQKDLNELAPVVAKQLAGREKEIGDGMAQAYAAQFTEQELKDLVAFYKSTLGQKLINSEPRAIEQGMAFTNSWAQNFAETVASAFRAEMKKRGKEI
ncbi:hypothetical protein C2U70_04810 [Bradyrhizobium guangdongense]|uniref:DUF2059 domain-containing protein n=1 Tax=Bradyrhizobium guangdongense TaxID=1325090 RepID=UPI00112E99C8|nr:DUF2059 domain-containing protein [Bradyrhizobium guangdongense]TPQ40611.1 hypothetical protein C2U70_04810 [Bradyrhizobium guangdongense]